MTTLYAQPYDTSACGFYFDSAEEYERAIELNSSELRNSEAPSLWPRRAFSCPQSGGHNLGERPRRKIDFRPIVIGVNAPVQIKRLNPSRPPIVATEMGFSLASPEAS